MAVINCEADVEFVTGVPEPSSVGGNPGTFYVDISTIPKDGDWGDDAVVWYRWDEATQEYVIGGGPKPKPRRP